MDKEKTITRVNVELPVSTWKKVGLLSVLNSEDKKVIVEKALEDYYKKHGKEK